MPRLLITLYPSTPYQSTLYSQSQPSPQPQVSHLTIASAFLNAQQLLRCRRRDDKDCTAISCRLIFTLYNVQPDLSIPVLPVTFEAFLIAQLSIFCALAYTYLLYTWDSSAFPTGKNQHHTSQTTTEIFQPLMCQIEGPFCPTLCLT